MLLANDDLSVSNEAHETRLKHLADHPERFWVDSFVNIMRHVKAKQASTGSENRR